MKKLINVKVDNKKQMINIKREHTAKFLAEAGFLTYVLDETAKELTIKKAENQITEEELQDLAEQQAKQYLERIINIRTYIKDKKYLNKQQKLYRKETNYIT